MVMLESHPSPSLANITSNMRVDPVLMVTAVVTVASKAMVPPKKEDLLLYTQINDGKKIENFFMFYVKCHSS